MRALALKLVQGDIDQVAGLFLVTSVSARILSLAQVEDMRKRVQAWTAHVQATLGSVASQIEV